MDKNNDKIIGIVLLAAGNSKRYHGKKLLDMINGKEMFMNILELTAEINNVPHVIVTQYEEIKDKALQYGFEVVMNNNPDIGISHSIHLGLQRILEMDPSLDGVLFSVCDQPYLNKATLEHLIEVYSNSKKNNACISYQNILGNPCIIGKKYFDELFLLEGDRGGKIILSKVPGDVELVQADNSKELIDIDRKEDIIV